MSMALTNIVPDEKRLIKGERLKFVDGRWSDSADSPVAGEMLVLRRIRAVQCWHEQKIADCIAQKDNEALPDVDELNAKIPESKWEQGLDGKPRGPWQNVWGFYLCNPQDGSIFTFLNGTIGSRIAYDKLNDRIEMMRMLRGANVAPVVKLDSRPMKTKYGNKLRPEFTIISWMGPSGDTTPALEHKATNTPAALKPMPEPTASEELNDEVPWLG
jgi:hypothetical protein